MALVLVLALLLIIVGCVWLFVAHPLWFPAGASAQAAILDHQFTLALWLLGALFVAGHIVLALSLVRSRRKSQSAYSRGNWRFEVAWTLAITAIFFWFNISGDRLWSSMKLQPVEANAIQVEVTGAQFQWYFRYPGPDGKLGRTNAQKFAKADEGNPLGLDPGDPAGADDIVSTSMVVPVGHDVDLNLRALDVIHSLFIPAMRFKQDTVPGMDIHTHFRPVQMGEYEIACAELCGTGHYRMRAVIRVVSEEEFAQWLKTRPSS